MTVNHKDAKPSQVALIGWGAHGRDILAIYDRKHPYLGLQRYDDDVEKHSNRVWRVEDWDGRPYLIGVNDPRTRAVIDQRLNWERAADALIDDSAIIGASCRVSAGCVIGQYVVLAHHVELGRHVHVNYGASMVRTKIGHYSTIAPGVTICGDVTIGERVFIGAGAVIKDRVSIGDDAFIRMGARIIEDVGAGVRVG